MAKFCETTTVEFFFKKLQAAVSGTFPETNSTVDISCQLSEDKNIFFTLFQNLPKILFIYVWLLKEPFFVCSVYYSSSVNGNFKETFFLACFWFYLHFEHFHTAAFVSSWKIATGIFSHLLWYHSPQTEQNTMKNPLSPLGSPSKNGTWHLQYNGKRCATSFPRLNHFVCCGNGVSVSFSNCANRCYLITLWL